MIAEINVPVGTSNFSLVASYAWGLDLSGSFQGAGGVGGLLAITDVATTATHFAAFDGNGNVGALVKASDGTLSAKYDFNAFGDPVQTEGSFATSNPFRFSTKYTDAETGHLYYGYRCYAPETGRWLSRDPIEEEGGANLYAFIGNDSANKVDLLGLVDMSDLIRAFTAIGAAQQACRCQARVVDRLGRLADRLGNKAGIRESAHEVLKALSESNSMLKEVNSRFKNVNQLLTGLALLLAKTSGEGSVDEVLKTYASNKGLLDKIGSNLSNMGKILSAGQAATSGDAYVVALELGKQSVEYLSKGTSVGPITRPSVDHRNTGPTPGPSELPAAPGRSRWRRPAKRGI